MAVFFKAAMSEMLSLFDKYSEIGTPTMEDKRLQKLERLLLRIRVIVEEAEGRHITNQAMVHQLNLLRKEMYRGYFTMDNLRCQGIEAKDHDVSHSFALSKFNPAKRIFASTLDTHREKDLQQVLLNLNNIIEDANELVKLLKNYPPLYRQPYSMHLFIDKCMFGRQMETERILNFLMPEEHPGTRSPGILPIVGPTYVGKSTLVAHVCNDARVRNYFSRIMVITGDDINSENLDTVKDGSVMIHQHNALGENDRSLVIIEFSEDVREVAWNTFYSSFGASLGRGSKVIVTSRSKKVKTFGTTQALVLNFLPPEAYWYFFKILTFGSTYSGDHPKLESIGMEIARGLKGSFVGANMTSGILRNNFVPQHWWMFLGQFRRSIQRNLSLFGENPYDLARKGKPITCRISDDEFVVWDDFRVCPVEENFPMITHEDVLSGSVKREGKFNVLTWKSQIPPYGSCIVSGTIKKSQQ
ncbi:hypothetical protein ACP70R_015173 [Stipagrostis hirtigluma subsp. patula]